MNTTSLGGQGGQAPAATGGRMGFGPPVTGPEQVDSGAPDCQPGANWSEAEEIAELVTMHDEALLALSPDETALLFRRQTKIYFAERESLKEVFQVTTLAWPNGYDASLGVALSADTLSLVLVANDSGGFALLSREARGQSFDTEVNAEPFEVLNSLPGTAGVRLSHPLLARGDGEIWWVESRQETSVWMASFGGDFVARGVQVGCGELGCDLMLEGLGGDGKFPSALSEDGRSLFLFDEYAGSELRFRDHPVVDAGFFEAETMGERRDVHPNAACDRLYFTEAGDIWLQNRLD